MSEYASVVVWDAPTRRYLAYSPWLPGAMSDGTTVNEARVNLAEAIELIKSHYRQFGLTMQDLYAFPQRVNL